MVKKLLFILTFVCVAGCSADVISLSGEDFQSKFKESEMNSADSWWYGGSDEKKHYFVLKKPLSNQYFSIDKSDITLLIDETPKMLDEDGLINLKETDIRFK